MELLQIVAGGGAAVALLAGFVMFIKGLKDQRDAFVSLMAEQTSSFKGAMDAQVVVWKEHALTDAEASKHLGTIIEKNTETLSRITPLLH